MNFSYVNVCLRRLALNKITLSAQAEHALRHNATTGKQTAFCHNAFPYGIQFLFLLQFTSALATAA